MSNPVPVGWTKTTIGKLTSKNSLFNDGDWVESKDQDPAGLNRLIQLADVGDGKFVDKSTRYLNDEQFDRLNCTRLQRGDILIARMPDPLGRACMFPLDGGKFATVVDIAIIRTPNADHYWLMSAINSSEFRFQIELNASGTTRTRIARGALSQIPLVVPPLPEQQKIASILTAVDDVIESTQAQINKLKDLKTGMMQELLTKGIGHTEFKDSPVGRIPKAWEVKVLDFVIEKIVDCEHKTAPYVEKSEYMVVRTNNVKDGQLIFDDIKFTSEDGYKEWTSRLTPSEGDVLFTREAPAGESCMVPKGLKVCMGQRMVLLRPNKSLVDGRYFSTYLNSQRAIDAIFRFSIGTTVSRINIEDIRKIPCIVPPLNEQIKISKCIDSIKNRTLTLESKLRSLLSTKKALMQDLLAGKVRVKVN